MKHKNYQKKKVFTFFMTSNSIFKYERTEFRYRYDLC